MTTEFQNGVYEDPKGRHGVLVEDGTARLVARTNSGDWTIFPLTTPAVAINDAFAAVLRTTTLSDNQTVL